jgi:hypothetical protein
MTASGRRNGGTMMQAHLINDPAHWRKRAEEMRTHAHETRHPEGKRMMLKLAGDYDKLAKRAEEWSNEKA